MAPPSPYYTQQSPGDMSNGSPVNATFDAEFDEQAHGPGMGTPGHNIHNGAYLAGQHLGSVGPHPLDTRMAGSINYGVAGPNIPFPSSGGNFAPSHQAMEMATPPGQRALETAASSPGAQSVDEPQSNRDPNKKVTRACDNCRKKKVKCEGGDASGQKSCKPCEKEGTTCGYERVPQKRGPNKGYIQELKDDLELVKSHSAALEDGHSRRLKSLFEFVRRLENDLDEQVQHSKRLEKLVLDAGIVKELPELPEVDSHRTKRRRMNVQNPEEISALEVDGEKVVTKYLSSRLNVFFPFLPKHDPTLEELLAGLSSSDRTAYFLALSATTAQQNKEDELMKAEGAYSVFAEKQGLAALHINMYMLMSRQALGLHDIIRLPSGDELVERINTIYNALDLAQCTPVNQESAFKEGAANLSYKRMVRLTSLSARLLVGFYNFGVKSNVSPPLVDIPEMSQEDSTFLPAETRQLHDVLSLVMDMSKNPQADISQGLSLELASLRLMQSHDPGFPDKALDMARSLARDVYTVSEDGKTSYPGNQYHAYPLAICIQTLLDLQTLADNDEKDNSVLRDGATSTLKELGNLSARVTKDVKSTWDDASFRIARRASMPVQQNQQIDWAGPIQNGCLQVLLSQYI